MFTPEETVRAIRASLVGEQDAISQYDAQAEQVVNPLVRRVLEDISREEKVHQGELITLLAVLGDDEMLLKDGSAEVKKVMRELDLCLDEACTKIKPPNELGFLKNGGDKEEQIVYPRGGFTPQEGYRAFQNVGFARSRQNE